MGSLILAALIIFILYKITPKPSKSAEEEKFVFKERFCPPHKWRYVEVKDSEGVTQAWRIVCDLCGPMKPIEPPNKSEF